MRIAIATFDGLPDGDEDFPALREALAGHGYAAESVVWDSGADWAGFDLVVVRSTWDYTTRLEEYLSWADGVGRLANRAEVLRWNTDKRYLRELAEAGIPVVPTLWDPVDLPEWPECVIKPVVSAGSQDTARWSSADAARARVHLDALRAEGRAVMVQPYLDAIDTAGETALVFFGGEFSHAVRKAPILSPGSGVQEIITDEKDEREKITPRQPSPAELALAHEVLAAAPQDLLYARVDLIPGPDGSPVLLELELSEPSLFLRHAPGSADRLAAAIKHW